MKREKVYYYVFSKERIGLVTNIKGFKWTFGNADRESTEAEFRGCLIRVRVMCRKTEEISIDEERMDKFSYYYAEKGAGKIYYKRDFFLGRVMKYSLEMGEDEINIDVNPFYHRFVKHRFLNLHGINLIAADAAAALLLQKGLLPIHCGAFAKEGSATLLIAPPKVGKSLTVLNYCRDRGAYFLSEDIALTDGSMVFSVPNTGTVRYYSSLKEGLGERISSGFFRKIPFLELLIPYRKMSDFLEEDTYIDEAAIGNIVLLGRSVDTKVLEVDEPERKIGTLEGYTLKYLTSPSLFVYEYFNDEFSLERIGRKGRKILKKLVKGKNIRMIKARNPANYRRIIDRNIFDAQR